MKTVLLKTFSLIIAVSLTVIIFIAAPGTYEHPLATIINKVALINATKSPRIIFFGGSEVLVGIDSEMIYRKFGLTVVNMAVYGGFGISDMLHLAAPAIGSGDIVIIIPEYSIIKRGFDSEDMCNKWLLLVEPRYAMEKIYLGHGKYPSIVGDISDLLQCKIEGMWTTLWNGKNPFSNGAAAYDRRSNRFGDLMKNWTYVPAEKLAGRGWVLHRGPVSPAVIRTLNDFHDAAAARGASVFLAFSGYPEGEYRLNHDEIESMADQLRKSLRFPVLGAPSDTIFPYEMFSNTVYHLRFEGRYRRTITLIRNMEKANIKPLGGNGAR